MSSKKIIKILGVVAMAIILGLVAYLFLLSIAFDRWSEDIRRYSISGKDIIKTEIGEEFIIEYSTDSFLRVTTTVDIYNKYHIYNKNNSEFIQEIASYITREDYIRPKFRLLVDNEKVRAYEITVIKIDGSEGRKLYIYRTPYSSYRRTKKDEIDFWIKYYDAISFSGGTDSTPVIVN